MDLNQVQITLEQGTNFFTKLQKLKAMVSTPKDFKKFWSKACKLANKPEDVEILSAKYVIQSAQNDWAEERLFQDSVINVLDFSEPQELAAQWSGGNKETHNARCSEAWATSYFAYTHPQRMPRSLVRSSILRPFFIFPANKR